MRPVGPHACMTCRGYCRARFWEQSASLVSWILWYRLRVAERWVVSSKGTESVTVRQVGISSLYDISVCDRRILAHRSPAAVFRRGES